MILGLLFVIGAAGDGGAAWRSSRNRRDYITLTKVR